VIDLDNDLVASKDNNNTKANDIKVANNIVSLVFEKTDTNKSGLNKYTDKNKAANGKNATVINQDINLK
jgi:hypothetical protein